MDKETASTELRIYFEFATKDGDLTDEDVEFVKTVLEEHNLSYDHYDEYNISTEMFVDTAENMEEVDEIESSIGDHFEGFEISRFTEDSEIYGIEPGTYQTWISIEKETRHEKGLTTSIDWKNKDMEDTEGGNDNQDQREFETKDRSFLEERRKNNKTSKAVEHTIFEEIPAQKKIRLEYVESADSLEEADRNIVEPQGVVESTLYCECGDVFERWEAALDHIRELRT